MLALEVLDRHLLLRLEGGLALVDTGSPYDIGRGGAASLLGQRWQPPSELAMVLDAASKHLGTRVEFLLGYPTLRQGHLLLDWSAGTARFEPARAPPAGASRVPIALRGDVPFLDLRWHDAGRTVRAVLDSGAALSYVPPEAVAGRAPLRRERDFHPSIGPFETDVWGLPISVAGRDIALEAGVLPPTLRALAHRSGGWILGSDFFRGRAVQISYPDRMIYDTASLGPAR